MEKFKQLRLKFEQRRSMRSQAAKAEEAEATVDESESKEESSLTNAENKEETSEESIIKVASMPVRKTPLAEKEKPLIGRIKASESSEETQNTATDKKVKVVSMPVKRSSATVTEQPKTEMKFKINKDKPASMPVKRRDTSEKAQNQESKSISVTDNKDAGKPKEKSKVVSMPVKARKTSEKDTTVPLMKSSKSNEPSSDEASETEKVKPVKHVSMPVKRRDVTEKETVQTDKIKTSGVKKTDETNKTPGSNSVLKKPDLKDTANSPVSGDIVHKTTNEPVSVINKPEKDKQVKFVSVNKTDDDSKTGKKPEVLKSVLKKSTIPEDKSEAVKDRLAIEEANMKAKERKSSLSEDKLQELEETFAVFDQNRDGEITKEELGAVLYALGQRPTVTEVQALIRSVDLDIIGIGDSKPGHVVVHARSFGPKFSVHKPRHANRTPLTSAEESGTIDFDEFVKIFSSKLTVDPEQELQEVFCVFDSNLDGFISDNELFEVLQKLGEQTSLAECKKMIKEADLNGDGKVDYREFKAILNSR